MLSQVLRRLNLGSDPRLIVDADTADDAAVYRLDARRALVQTVDFITPIVDDPQVYGEIAAANSLSDVYAMGGRPLTALNILGVPDEVVSPATIHAILRGGAAKAREAGCLIVGGHTIRNPQPIYGLSVTGLVDPRRVLTNAGARPGDVLILTKPLGTGIVTTGVKRGLASPRAIRAAVRSMTRLNDVGAELGAQRRLNAATDITGFGLLGHLGSLCRASGVGAEIDAAALPALPEVWALIERGCVPGGTKANLGAAAGMATFEAGVPEAARLLAADAQTSGGLLLCVPEAGLNAVLGLLKRRRTPCAAVIGRIVTMKLRKPGILVRSERS